MKQFIQKNKRTKDFSFAKFFDIDKSPHTIFNWKKGVWEHVAKHKKTVGKVVWDSRRKGAYVFKHHGELKYSN